jgi:hypothetical protein
LSGLSPNQRIFIMRSINIRLASALVVSLALTGCMSTNPNAPLIAGSSPDANTARRSTPEFCKRYARQTAGNTYETNSDLGAEAGALQQARINGGAAYDRCLAGRTN